MTHMTSRTLTRSSAVLAVAVAAQALSSNALAQDGILDQFPLVVTCEYKGTQHVFYLSRVTADGTATYLANTDFAGTITLTGVAKAVGAEQAGSCLGKTLQDLRASGQARDVK
ncbi:hypothetical protein [Ensifer sp. MJa1]|uniref:hypothetical protein n=1 Tax=Ensifer sp. MJa1 TaxID=2919888 RepID=UPI0030084666